MSQNNSSTVGRVDTVEEVRRSREDHGSHRQQSTPDPAVYHLPTSAADVGQDGYGEVRFSRSQGKEILREAERRAPKGSNSVRQHLVGVAGEAAVATMYGASFDRRIMPDYEGDDGYDIELPPDHRSGPARVQVKTTENWQNPERIVSREEIDQANIFVLCCTLAPTQYVEIVGVAEQLRLKWIGETYGREGYLLAPEYLRPIGPVRYGPTEVRRAMSNRLQ